ELGYMIKQVPNANEALKLIDADANIDLIFSDLVMPGGMDGVELGHAIRRRYPAIPVLLATGYSESARDAVQQGFVVLQKPFDLLALEQAVREARKWRVEPAPGLAGQGGADRRVVVPIEPAPSTAMAVRRSSFDIRPAVKCGRCGCARFRVRRRQARIWRHC